MKLLLTILLFLASNALAFDVVGSLPQGLGDGRYVQKAGDTMTGPLTLSASTLTVTGVGISLNHSADAAVIQKFINPNGELWVGVERSIGAAIINGTVNGAGVIGTTGLRPLQFGTNNTAYVYLSSSGAVGMGNAAPGAKLDVTGDANISTSLTAASMTVTGNGGIGVTYGINAATGVFTNTGAASLDIGGGLNAGTGNVAIIDATGKITALSSTYLANLSGANLTALTAANISAGSLGVGVIASSVAVDGVYTNAILASAVTDAKIATGITSSKLTGALPAISGASLTNLTAANIDAGALGASVLASSAAIGAFYSAPNIRTNLGLAIGTDVQAYDADLADLADGSLTGSLVGSGVPAANIAAGSLGGSVLGSSITLAAMYGAPTLTGTNITAIPSASILAGNLDAVTSLTASTATITGNAFSVGGSTLVVTAGKVGIGNAAPSHSLDIQASTTPVHYIGARILNPTNTNSEISSVSMLLALTNSTANKVQGKIELSESASIDDDKGKMSFYTDEGNSLVNHVTIGALGGLYPYSRTLAQLQALAVPIGGIFYCSNCTPAKLVISTGTSAGNFADAIGGTFQ